MGAATWDAILRKRGVGIHPAATLFPLMAPDELEELARDIDTNNLTSPLCLWRADEKAQWQLIDGRNRCAAMARLIDGEERITGAIGLAAQYEARTDPWGFVVSANLHRRHLTVEKKREIAAALLKADPSKSDRRVAAESGLNRTDVELERRKLEQTDEVSIPDTRIGRDGVAQPATKPKLDGRLPVPAAARALWEQLAPDLRAAVETRAKAVGHAYAKEPVRFFVDYGADLEALDATIASLIPLVQRYGRHAHVEHPSYDGARKTTIQLVDWVAHEWQRRNPPKPAPAAPPPAAAANNIDEQVEAWAQAMKAIEDSIVAAGSIECPAPYGATYYSRVDIAKRCLDVLRVDIDDVWRAIEPEVEPEEDGEDPKVKAAIETHRAAIKRLNPDQRNEFWGALKMVKRKRPGSKSERWQEAVDELRDIQGECEAYSEVPDGLRDEERAERYEIIAGIDLTEIEGAEF